MCELPEYRRGGDTLVNLPGVGGFVFTGENSPGASGQPGELRDCPGGFHQVRPHSGFHGQQTQRKGLLEEEDCLPPEDPDLEVLSQGFQEVR